MIEVREAADVTAEVFAAAEEAEGWFPGRIDWDSFWDRLEDAGVSVEDTDSPAARTIERYVRKLRASE